jgi:hypothetical protein
VVTLILLAPLAARAEEAAGRAALITIPSPQAPADEVARTLSEMSAAFEREFADQFISPEAAADQIGGANPEQRLADAAVSAGQAREVMEAFDDLQLAVDLLQGASQNYLLMLPLLDTVETPFELLYDLATVFLALERTDRLEATLAEAARLNPLLPMDTARLPSRMVTAAAEVRSSRLPSLALLNPFIAARFTENLGVDRLAVGRLGDDGELRLEVYDRRGRRTARLNTRADQLRTSAGRLARELRLDRSAPPLEEGESDGEELTPWYRSWWFITSMVVGIALLTTVTVVAINASSED